MKRVSKIALGIIVVILLGGVGLVGWATLSAQEATESAINVLNENDIPINAQLLVFSPDTPTNRGLIYYPGGLVDPAAYAVTAQGIADQGYMVFIPKMPLNLAFTGINKADMLIMEYGEIESWVIGGHSLGGAMAAEYAKNNSEKLDGLIMYASYPANNNDFTDFPIPILCITASNDPGTTGQTAFYEDISESATLVIIEGGNHKQYADYSFQRNDGIPTITAAEQQDQIIEATVQFLESLD